MKSKMKADYKWKEAENIMDQSMSIKGDASSERITHSTNDSLLQSMIKHTDVWVYVNINAYKRKRLE